MTLKMGNFCHFTSKRQFSDNFNLFTTSEVYLDHWMVQWKTMHRPTNALPPTMKNHTKHLRF